MGGSWNRYAVAVAAASCMMLSATAGDAQDWVEFVEQSAERILADPEVGLDDPEEKDIALGDVNRNGYPDMVVVRKVPWSNPGGKRNVLFLNQGGVFIDVTAEKIPAFLDETDDRDVLLVDVDGDGWLDIVTAPTFGDQPRVYMNRGEIDGDWLGFAWEPDRIPPFDPGPKFCAVAAGDVTGNGLADLYFVDYDSPLENRLMINDGNGFFTDETERRFQDPDMYVSDFGTGAQIVDLNGNGWNDIVWVNTLGANPRRVVAVYNDGTGHFDRIDYIDTGQPYMSQTGDLSLNGRPDVYVVDDQQDRYLFNIGTNADGMAIWETHTVTNSPGTASFGGNIDFADMDGDGIPDILVADVDVDIQGCDDRHLVILRGQETPDGIRFTDPLNGAQRPWLPNGTHDVQALDINGNGLLDLWIATCDGNRIFMQTGAGAADLSFVPPSLDFGELDVGTTSPPQAGTLRNLGEAGATELAFGTPGSGFDVDASDCEPALAAGEACEVIVTFTPVAGGPAEETLEVGGSEGASASLSLEGIGFAPPVPELAFAPSSLDFGDVELDATSPAQSAMLQNTGDLVATELTFSPAESGFDAVTDACGDILPAGESCEIVVTFAPTEPGPAAAMLAVNSDQGVTAELGLIGRGMAVDVLFTAVALELDPEILVSDGNGVLEPGELAVVATAWRNDGTVPRGLTGTASGFTGPEGATYTLEADAADYGDVAPGETASCRNTGVCYRVAIIAEDDRPATRWMATFDETLSNGEEKSWTLYIGDSFSDVPRESPFYRSVETLLHHEVTGGCAGSGAVAPPPPQVGQGTARRSRVVRPTLPSAMYCPAAVNTRGQMPAFVLRALEGGDYAPPACTPGQEVFADVPATSGLCPWIEELVLREVVAGCDGDNYCPNAPVTRAQMSVFLLRTLEGPGYTPPACTGLFADLPCPSPFADWVEELARREITGGCTDTTYCPTAPVNRQQMAVFVTATFGLGLYGP